MLVDAEGTQWGQPQSSVPLHVWARRHAGVGKKRRGEEENSSHAQCVCAGVRAHDESSCACPGMMSRDEKAKTESHILVLPSGKVHSYIVTLLYICTAVLTHLLGCDHARQLSRHELQIVVP